MSLSHFGNFRINSQRSMRRVSLEYPLAEDSQCFATLRRLHGNSTEAVLQSIHAKNAVKVAKV